MLRLGQKTSCSAHLMEPSGNGRLFYLLGETMPNGEDDIGDVQKTKTKDGAYEL